MKMHQEAAFVVVLCGALLAAPSPTCADTGPFSVDVVQLTYSYAGASFTPNFTVPGGFAPNTQDPASGWYLSWNALESPVTSGSFGNVWRMTMPQAVLGQPEPPRALSSINGYGPFGSNNAPVEWEVNARITNIANATTSNTDYGLRVGAGTFEAGGVNLRIGVNWFTGDFEGVYYDRSMRIGSSLGVGLYIWESNDPGIMLVDNNPSDTILDLRVVVSNAGQSLSTFYRIDNGPSWIAAHSHTLPAGAGVLSGFALSHPYVAIYNDVSAVPELAPAYLLAAGMGVLLLVLRTQGRRRFAPV